MCQVVCPLSDTCSAKKGNDSAIWQPPNALDRPTVCVGSKGNNHEEEKEINKDKGYQYLITPEW